MYEDQLLQQRGKIVGYIHSRLRDPDLSEDLFQDSLLKALQHAGELRADERLIPWFYRIVNNAIADYYRQRAVASRYQPMLALEAELSAQPDEWAALCGCFLDLLPTLKPEYAALIQQLDLAEADPEQVASSLHLTRNNLKVRHHRARQALRQRLEETCRMCATHGCLDCTCRQSPPAATAG